MNRNQQYMLRFNMVRCVFLLFYVLMENHIILYVYEYSDVIKLPKSYPPAVVGRGYRLSNFWLAKELNKKLQQQWLQKP